ncbi:ABC transporter permease [Corallococcus carmarthensis]|uniref:ABC transporter permease n=2 Tax=Corallococcus carmarthensis TaxID=2316728 RepID=A0A3A8JRH0_9BACT|nr:ABC transporter permease [Corallococcus carmarthensis]NOK22317.1 ABC transporter permease [Corallococcus carmarthensis]RKG94924.1 ABC transporter permease [Corallococcus carmarthensis]
MTSGRWERWGDRLNPLVVKEVRQGLRTRIFWVCFGLLLAACLVLSLIAFGNTHDSTYTREGRTYFFSFFVCLALVHFGVIPFNAYRSLAREREDETWSLLLLTGLGPRRILRGKVASFLVQAVLYASAVGPFLLFSYFLNGIDLPTILVVLLFGGAWMVFLTLVSVCAATLADSRMGRAAVRLALVGVLVVTFFQSLTLTYVVTQERGASFTFDRDFFLGLGAAFWLLVSEGWLVFETAVARLSLVTEDYTRHPRRALVVQVVLTFVGMTAMWWLVDRKDDIPGVMGILGGLHLIFASLFVATDVDGQSRPLRAGTRPWSLFKPGALRGFRLSVLLLLGWAAGCAVLLWFSESSSGNLRVAMSVMALALYGVLYLSLALLLGRMPRSGRFASPVSVRLLYVLVGVLAAGVPPLLAVFLNLEGRDELLNLLNPVLGTMNFGKYDYSDPSGLKMPPELLLCVALVALLAAFATDRVLADRERRAHQQ